MSVREFFGGGPIVIQAPAAGFVYFAHPDGAVGRRFPDGEEQKGFRRDCGAAGGGFGWVSTSITSADLVDQAVDRARQLAPRPVLDMNPSPASGGIVNLGLWLAVEPTTPAPVRVEAGGLWAEARLSITRTTWDMGNGDTVTCAGIGVPIADLDTVEPGPCGYTYARSSPDDQPYQLTANVTWRVDYRSSGGSGSAGTIDRSVTVPYDVDEIQIVGRRSASSGG